MVLGDGVAYASRHLRPDVLIDMATLTGAQGTVSGGKHAAVLSSCEELERQAVSAGRSSGDLVFPLLYCPELLLKEFASEVADLKNSVKDRSNATCSAAGHFVEAHIDPDFKGAWLHVDMAYPVHQGERATGWGCAFLHDLLHI